MTDFKANHNSPRLWIRERNKEFLVIGFSIDRGTLELTVEQDLDFRSREPIFVIPLGKWMPVEQRETGSSSSPSFDRPIFSDEELLQIANALSADLTAAHNPHVILKRGDAQIMPMHVRERAMESYRDWMGEKGWSFSYDLERGEMSQGPRVRDSNGVADYSTLRSREFFLRQERMTSMLSDRYAEEQILAQTPGVNYLTKQEILFSDLEQLLNS